MGSSRLLPRGQMRDARPVNFDRLDGLWSTREPDPCGSRWCARVASTRVSRSAGRTAWQGGGRRCRHIVAGSLLQTVAIGANLKVIARLQALNVRSLVSHKQRHRKASEHVGQ